MNRRIPILWLIPTLLLGLDLGWRAGGYSGLAVRAQSPPNAPDRPAQPNSPAQARTEPEIHRDLSEAYDRFAPVNAIFQKVARTLSPSVVHINARKAAADQAQGGEVEESGSGVVIDTKYQGQYILTNNHVVQDAPPRWIRIQLVDGRVISPEKVWTDPKADIAVLRLADNAPKLAPARLGNSDDIEVGTWVLALGSPFGLMHSVSQGIISARGRHEAELFQDGVENQDFLQTDAAINPGNSGGPLVNLRGEVIGINTAIASQGGGSEGVGFSIPINLARWIMDQLLTHGQVNRGAMGIDLDDVEAPVAEQLGMERPRGAIVTAVHPESPAQRAGMKGRDVIIRFNKNDVTDLNHLINLVSMAPIGKPAEVVVWRDRKAMTLEVTVGSRDRVLARLQPPTARRGNENPNEPVTRPSPSRTPGGPLISAPWGVKVKNLEPAQAEALGLPRDTQGGFVAEVAPDSPLARELSAGDVISAVNGRRFATARGLVEALKLAVDEVQADAPAKKEKPLEIEVIRSREGEASQTFVLRIDS